ncbi:MAG: redox-sensing transcriptional repressor Rex [Pyrinomonadaceae bacterium]|nr:redox-sensing transcriptional repressor Rex [Pyrinomonadaceae bacterium]
MKGEKISELTTNRLSVYLRCLNELDAQGEASVSSDAMARRFHMNSAQIRKDLANFGEFGTRGVGYNVKTLRDHLTSILGLDREHRVGIIGAGRLGAALADYYGFRKANFTVAAIFDSDPAKIGNNLGEVAVLDAKDFSQAARSYMIDVAVIAVPAEAAQSALDLVEKAGIKAVLNFAPVSLRASSDIKINSIDLTTSLESLSYFLASSEDAR